MFVRAPEVGRLTPLSSAIQTPQFSGRTGGGMDEGVGRGRTVAEYKYIAMWECKHLFGSSMVEGLTDDLDEDVDVGGGNHGVYK